MIMLCYFIRWSGSRQQVLNNSVSQSLRDPIWSDVLPDSDGGGTTTAVRAARMCCMFNAAAVFIPATAMEDMAASEPNAPLIVDEFFLTHAATGVIPIVG